MTKFVALRPKTYSYLIYYVSVNKKAKGTKNFKTKREIKVEDYKKCQEANRLENQMKYL